MKELIELRTFIENEIEKATPVVSNWGCDCKFCVECKNTITQSAFSLVIKQLDLILNNSVVKPSERRSPTDESFDGVSRPNERQNPLEEILLCGCKLTKFHKNCYYREFCDEHGTEEFSINSKA